MINKWAVAEIHFMKTITERIMNELGYVVIPGILDIIPRSARITTIIYAPAKVPRIIAEIVSTLSHLKSFCKDALIG